MFFLSTENQAGYVYNVLSSQEVKDKTHLIWVSVTNFLWSKKSGRFEATFEEPKVTYQHLVVLNFAGNAYWSNKAREHGKSSVMHDDLLTVIERKLKYNVVNQLITKW